MQTDDISRVSDDLMEDSSLPVLPIEGPRWTVSVQLVSRVLVAQNIVAHDSEGDAIHVGR